MRSAFLALLLLTTPARAQTRPASAEVGIDASVAFLSSALSPLSAGSMAAAHGGWELSCGLAPEVEIGFASWTSNVAEQQTFWFAGGARYTARWRIASFFAASHIGYGNLSGSAGPVNFRSNALAVDISGGFLFQLSPEISFGPRLAATHLDRFGVVPLGLAQLWYEFGATLQLNLRP